MLIYELYSGIDRYANDKLGEQYDEELIDSTDNLPVLYKKFEYIAKQMKKLSCLREHQYHRCYCYILEIDTERKLPTLRINKLFSRTIYCRSYSKRTDIMRIRCHNGKWIWKEYNILKNEWERIL